MISPRRREGKSPVAVAAAVALVAAGGVLSYCTLTNGCPFRAHGATRQAAGPHTPQPPETRLDQKNQGEEVMLFSTTPARGARTVDYAGADDFAQKVLKSDVPVLVDFYADWCGPCQRIAPVLAEIAAETPGARIVKVNVDDSPELAAQYDVQSIPSLKVFKNGRVTAEHVGLANKQQIKALITR